MRLQQQHLPAPSLSNTSLYGAAGSRRSRRLSPVQSGIANRRYWHRNRPINATTIVRIVVGPHFYIFKVRRAPLQQLIYCCCHMMGFPTEKKTSLLTKSDFPASVVFTQTTICHVALRSLQGPAVELTPGLACMHACVLATQ